MLSRLTSVRPSTCQLCEAGFEGNTSRAVLVFGFGFGFCAGYLFLGPGSALVVAALVSVLLLAIRERMQIIQQAQIDEARELRIASTTRVGEEPEISPKLELLLVRTMEKQVDAPICEICLECMVEGERIASSPNKDCVHSFHMDCITQALRRQTTCPCCRREYLDETNEEIIDETTLDGIAANV